MTEDHIEAVKRLNDAVSVEREQRELCVEDFKFAQVAGGMWDDDSSTVTVPKFEINKVALPISQTQGEQRQNRISIKVRPARGGGTEDVATVYNGLIRNIENISKFSNAKDNAFFEVLNSGIGAWYVTTEYVDNDSFEQDIKIRTIRSASTRVFMNPSSTGTNHRDSRYAFVLEEIPENVFKVKYPDVPVSGLSTDISAGTSKVMDHFRSSEGMVKIADYWYKKDRLVKKLLFSDGTVVEADRRNKPLINHMVDSGLRVENERTITVSDVKFRKVSGSDFLTDEQDWAGQYIPVVMIYGHDCWIDGKHFYRGMVRLAKDANRVYNYTTSAKIEAAASAPKDPYFVTPAQIKGHESTYRNFNVQANPFMLFNFDPQNPGIPKRGGAPSVQSSLIEQTQQADIDIQATTGKFAPSLGDNPDRQSGRALLAQQRQGDAGTFVFHDNLAKGIEFTGEILIDLIPHIYDTARIERIVKEDGETEEVNINTIDISGATENDLTLGRYDAVVDVSPSYKTQQTEALNTLTAIAQGSPLFAQISSDLIAKNLGFNFSDELSKRARRIMIQQGIVEPNEQEIKEAQAKQGQQQPTAAEKIQLELTKLQLEQEAAKVDEMSLNNDLKRVQILKTRAEIQSVLTKSIEQKAKVGKVLAETQELSGQAVLPLDDTELAARQENMRLLNEELRSEDLAVLDENLQQPPQQQQLDTNIQQGPPPFQQVSPDLGTVDPNANIETAGV
ncbi:MAG: hypothetical protein GY938_18005 [Ketobacter sp.]|nr:hypothetical protein [Ketobacter sp.]